MSKIELEAESKELTGAIKALTALLASDEAIKNQVSTELGELSERFATPRRTRCIA
jgi:DNA gyrase subunit A